MAVQFDVDEALLSDAVHIGGFKTRDDAVNEALKEFIISMKKKIIIILILCVCNTSTLFACASGYLFKIFPVGVVNNEIVTVDFQISRADDVEEDGGIVWHLRAYISTYTRNQQLIKALPYDSVKVKSEYLPKLQKIYNEAFAKIKMDFSSIELFVPAYISFCDFQKKCELIEIRAVTDTTAYTLIYKNKKYPLKIINDTLYYGFRGSLEYNGVPHHISSYRIYETQTIKLIVSHLGSGTDLYWREKQNLPPAKEHKPKIKFKDIKTAVYEEPMLHHGFGFDAFFVE